VPSSSADRLATAEDPRADTCAPASAAAAAAKPEMLPTTAHRHIMHARPVPAGLPACVHDPTVERHNDPSGRVSSQTSRIANPPRTAARRALSSKLSVTDGDVVVAMANDHPESIRRDRARLLDQRLQLSRGATFQRRNAWRAIRWHTQRGRSERSPRVAAMHNYADHGITQMAGELIGGCAANR
jgi:hypothetical protein